MTKAQEARAALLEERFPDGIYRCECCGKEVFMVEGHHVAGRYVRGWKKKLLDHKHNIQFVCYDCHYTTGRAKGQKNKDAFRKIQRERYKDFDKWYAKLPETRQERYGKVLE